MRERPLLIYDGECKFCRQWIERWRVSTGDRVDYETAKSVREEFPEITDEEFARSVQWVPPNGLRCAGAQAVLRALATSTKSGSLLLWLYLHAPAFAWVAEVAYSLVSRYRFIFSALTSLFWGADLRPPSYAISNRLFLGALGSIYLIAFLSYWLQIDGLIGENGILPAVAFFKRAHEVYGNQAYSELPTLFWFGATDPWLYAWCGAGILASVLLIIGITPAPCLIFLWIDYLSLTIAGQTFYQFQWDILLLEAGFLAIFLAPWRWLWRHPVNPPRAARFLLIWLLVRLMVASGVVKLTSGDYTWAEGIALSFHYYTQPLPTPLGWYAHQLPDWFQRLSVQLMFLVEIGFPWLLFGPRRLRVFAAGFIIFLQVLIMLTGNYGFFNWLTIALCLLAIDDIYWRWLPFKPGESKTGAYLPGWALGSAAMVLFLLSIPPFWSAFRPPPAWLRPITAAYESTTPYRSINSYGLFRVMTTTRTEIMIEGSNDGKVWKPYVFRYKPGDPKRSPPWVAPHMPRLDWQMWFAALGSVQNNPWFVAFVEKLLRGSPSVSTLLKDNPFPASPPKFIRATSDDYKFTTYAGRNETGNWWRVEPRAPYLPPVSLRD